MKYHAKTMSLHLKLSLHYKTQHFWYAQMIILSISDFGVITVILNPVDVSRRRCKLSFRPMWDEVKSRHFPNFSKVMQALFKSKSKRHVARRRGEIHPPSKFFFRYPYVSPRAENRKFPPQVNGYLTFLHDILHVFIL